MNRKINFDHLFETLGKYGRWQVLQAFAISWCWVYAAQSILTILVTGYSPRHWCKTDNTSEIWNLSSISNKSLTWNNSDVENNFVSLGKCEIIDLNSNLTLSCHHGYEYDLPKHASFVTEWDLVCDQDFLPQASQTLYMFGQAVGGYIISTFSDKFGRKRCYIIAFFFAVLCDAVASFVPDVSSFCVLRFFTGMFQMGSLATAYVLGIELFPNDSTYLVGTWFGVMWVLGVCTTPLLGYLFVGFSWRYIQITIAGIAVFQVYQIWFVDESIRWLYANKRGDEAYKLLKKAARINNVDMRNIDECLETSHDDKERHISILKMETSEKHLSSGLLDEDVVTSLTIYDFNEVNDVTSEVKPLSFIDILRHPKLRRHYLISWFLWPTQSFTYYGLSLMSNQLAGNRLLNLFLNGVVEIPTKLILFVVLKRFGRRTVIIVQLLCCAVSLITAACLSTLWEQSHVITVFVLLGKFFISGSFLTIWIYTPELYPTNLRSVGLGTASASARFAGMAAPFAGYMAMYIRWGPGVVFGSMCIVSSMLMLLLPETRGKPLIQTLNCVDSLYKKIPPKRSDNII